MVVGLLTTNSARFLRRALDSVKDLGPIVAVDGGSSDETLDILGEYGAECLVCEWPNNWAVQCNKLLAFARKVHPDAHYIYLHSDDEILRGRFVSSAAYSANNGGTTVYDFPRLWMLSETHFDGAFGLADFQRRLLPLHLGDLSFDERDVVHEYLPAKGMTTRREWRPVILHYLKVLETREEIEQRLERYNQLSLGQGDRHRDLYLNPNEQPIPLTELGDFCAARR